MILNETNPKKLLTEIESLRRQVASLREENDWFRRQVFGQKSERIVKTVSTEGAYYQPYLPGFEHLGEDAPKEEEKKTAVPAHTRRQSRLKDTHKISFPDDLPVERIELDLPEDEKVCQETGLPLVKINEEVCRKLALKPGSYFIKEYVRPIYALPKESMGGIRMMDMPDSIIPKCRADESLLADIMVKKFCDHLPLNRIGEAMTRDNIHISRQLLSNWTVRAGKALKPLYDLMFQQIRDSGNVFVDESPVMMLKPGKGKTHQGYMWIIAGGNERDPPERVYIFRTDRRHFNAEEMLRS